MARSAVSIRDVAALAGVSVGSASRVINGAGNVTPATREAVERAIRTLDYRPNHAAQTLRSRSSKTIGCLFTDVVNPLYAMLFRAIEERFRAEGYMLLLANGLNDPAREVETIRMFEGRGMDGMIVAPGNERLAAVVRAVRDSPVPMVVLDRDMDVGQDTVLFDHVGAMREAVAHLLALGHRRIALVLWKTPSRPVRRRVEGFRRAFRDAGLPVPDLILYEPTSTSPSFDDVERLLCGPDRPTAIVVHGTQMLIGAVQAALANGLRIPQDVSIVAIGDTDFARTHLPPIGVVSLDAARAAERVVALMTRRIAAGRDEPPLTETIPLTFEPRGSCAPVAPVVRPASRA